MPADPGPESSVTGGDDRRAEIEAVARATAEQRFWAKVGHHEHHDCWQWQGRLNPDGYGQVWNGTRAMGAHRFAYELLVGPVPAGLVIDHLCRNRGCVNPQHMEPVTHRENILRGEGPTAQHARAEACPYGHPYSGDNLYVSPTGMRRCRACRREYEQRRTAALAGTEEGKRRQREWRARQKEVRDAA